MEALSCSAADAPAEASLAGGNLREKEARVARQGDASPVWRLNSFATSAARRSGRSSLISDSGTPLLDAKRRNNTLSRLASGGGGSTGYLPAQRPQVVKATPSVESGNYAVPNGSPLLPTISGRAQSPAGSLYCGSSVSSSGYASAAVAVGRSRPTAKRRPVSSCSNNSLDALVAGSNPQKLQSRTQDETADVQSRLRKALATSLSSGFIGKAFPGSKGQVAEKRPVLGEFQVYP